MLADGVLVLRQVHAVRLVVANITVRSLDVLSQLVDRLIRCAGGATQCENVRRVGHRTER